MHDKSKRFDRVFGAQGGDHVFATDLDFITGDHANQFTRHAASVQFAKLLQHIPSRIDSTVGQVDHRRIHFHHSPPRHIRWQRSNVIQVGVRDKHGWRAHEIPRLNAAIKQQFQFVDSPTRLHSRARVAFDGQSIVVVRQNGYVFDHRG